MSMPTTARVRLFPLLLSSFGLMACGDPAVPVADTATPTDAATPTDLATPTDSRLEPDDVVVGPVCIGGRDFCVSVRESARCNADGSGVEQTVACTGASACEPLTGLCRATLCEPDATQCVDLRRVQTCAPDGSAWGAAEACAEGLTCKDGGCRACTPNAVECLSDLSYRRCSEDGVIWGPELACPFDHRCTSNDTEPGCKRCAVERTCVNASRVRERCTSGLLTWEEETVCPLGQNCVEGRCEACPPDRIECLDETTYRQCADDGSRWGQAQACGEGEACFTDRCLPYACSPRILFLVDFSGSMSPHWQAVRQGVEAIVAANPEVRFGLKAFPDADSWSCDVSADLEIPFETGLAETFDAWFAANPPSGSTPLAEGMRVMDANAELIFGRLGGTLVVLSDGEDSCYSSSATPIRAFLAQTTASLRLNHQVPTYAIGYSFGGNPGELDVIANNGGTNLSTHIPAGNEGELIEVLADIIDRVKFCDLAPSP
jgi:hypothetical protein